MTKVAWNIRSYLYECILSVHYCTVIFLRYKYGYLL